MNKAKLAEKFTEIVAIRLDVFDQRRDGTWPPDTALGRWERRYQGTPKEKLPPYAIELNHFKAEVDEFVAMLMRAIDDTEQKHYGPAPPSRPKTWHEPCLGQKDELY